MSLWRETSSVSAEQKKMSLAHLSSSEEGFLVVWMLVKDFGANFFCFIIHVQLQVDHAHVKSALKQQLGDFLFVSLGLCETTQNN
jgi:hypothetical protein